ncbi:MAG: hypothetical protein KDB15_15125, partial [Microthrixaceae bacterium]|nr:hypothetical protein [Microthrixaceae bacterium]
MILVDEFAPLQFTTMHEVNLGWAGVVAGHLGEHDAAEEIHTQLSAFAGRMMWTIHTFCTRPEPQFWVISTAARGHQDHARRWQRV